MSIYVKVNEVPPKPGPIQIGTANLAIFAFDDANDSIYDSGSGPVAAAGLGSRVMLISSYSEYESAYTGELSDTPMKVSVESYYNEEAGLGQDSAYLYLYRFKTSDSGETFTDSVAIRAGTLAEWRTEVGPVSTITNVKVSYDGAAAVDQVGGYTEEVDSVTGLKTGKITFNSGYPKNGSGQYQKINQDTDVVTISYQTTGITSAMKVLRQSDIQFVMFGYDHGRMTGSTPAEGIYNGTSFMDDMQELIAYCNQCSSTGFYRQGIISLPANDVPSDDATTYGGSGKWSDMRQNDIGQTRNAIAVAFKQFLGTGSGYLGEFDGAAVMAAMIRKNSVRTDVMMTIPTTAIQAYEDEAIQLAFKNSRIGTIVKASHLSPTSWLNFGYDFGIGVQRWINNVRCRYQIKHAIEAGLLALMLSKKIIYNIEGAYKIMDRITAIVEQARLNQWCDGLKSIEIPIMEYMLKRNKSQSDIDILTQAAESGVWENIAVTYIWGTNTERIEVSSLSEVPF
jgi:hypothetical protein